MCVYVCVYVCVCVCVCLCVCVNALLMNVITSFDHKINMFALKPYMVISINFILVPRWDERTPPNKNNNNNNNNNVNYSKSIVY